MSSEQGTLRKPCKNHGGTLCKHQASFWSLLWCLVLFYMLYMSHYGECRQHHDLQLCSFRSDECIRTGR